MTYAAAGIIEAVDFNSLATTLTNQLGVGTSSKGLGQSVSAITPVTAGVEDVTAVQWASLIQKTNSILAHEGQTLITPSSVIAGDIINYLNALATGVTAAYTNSGITGLALSDSAANTTSFSTAWGTTGSRALRHTYGVTFTSANAARYFFNAGGKIKLSLTRSGGSATSRNTEWTALCTALGSIQIGFNNTTKVGGGGSAPTTLLNSNNGGYWNSTASYVIHCRQPDGVAGYSTNYLDIKTKWSGTAANGGYPTLDITIELYNVWSNAFQDLVDGTCTASLVIASPSTSYLTNTWGTPTVTKSSAIF